MRDFRQLEIWKDSKDLGIEIYKIIHRFPKSEDFGLKSQISRSAVSIPSNIAEGCSRSNKSFIQYLNIALGSSFELETQLIMACGIGYISEDILSSILDRLHVIQKRINAFRNTIKKN